MSSSRGGDTRAQQQPVVYPLSYFRARLGDVTLCAERDHHQYVKEGTIEEQAKWTAHAVSRAAQRRAGAHVPSKINKLRKHKVTRKVYAQTSGQRSMPTVVVKGKGQTWAAAVAAVARRARRRRALLRALWRMQALRPPQRVLRLESHIYLAARLPMDGTIAAPYVVAAGTGGRARGGRALARTLANGAVAHDASYTTCLQLDVDAPSADGAQAGRRADVAMAQALRFAFGHVNAQPLLQRSRCGQWWSPATDMERDATMALPGNAGKVPARVACFARGLRRRRAWIWIPPGAAESALVALQRAAQGIDVAPVRARACARRDLARIEVLGKKAWRRARVAWRFARGDVGALAAMTVCDPRLPRSSEPCEAESICWSAPSSSKAPAAMLRSVQDDNDDEDPAPPPRTQMHPLVTVRGEAAASHAVRRSAKRARLLEGIGPSADDINDPAPVPLLVVRTGDGSLAGVCSRGDASAMLLALVRRGQCRLVGARERLWAARLSRGRVWPFDYPESALANAACAVAERVLLRGQPPVGDPPSSLLMSDGDMRICDWPRKERRVGEKKKKKAWRLKDVDARVKEPASTYVRAEVRAVGRGRPRRGTILLHDTVPVGVVTTPAPPGVAEASAHAFLRVDALPAHGTMHARDSRVYVVSVSRSTVVCD